ncbi:MULTISPECIES: hypothetical protein [unclassified Nocardia]|uniref:hypothetical protein n=1 Tax=unclassified Nocardia TaxID=2637762 RepID=UPI001CE3D9D7|nr:MULTISPECIES: hypothetical protein [unclassified Nocardia]
MSALADFPYTTPGSGYTHHYIEEVEIRIATADACGHEDTICPDCAESWQVEHLFTERLPWEPRARG